MIFVQHSFDLMCLFADWLVTMFVWEIKILKILKNICTKKRLTFHITQDVRQAQRQLKLYNYFMQTRMQTLVYEYMIAVKIRLI